MKHSLIEGAVRRRLRWTHSKGFTALYVALLLLTILSLYPRLSIGFTTNDDTEIALSVWQGRTIPQAVNIATGQGRFSQFFFFLEAAVPYLLRHPLYFYCVSVGIILSNLLLFLLLLRVLLKSSLLALFLTALTVAFLQYNWEHSILTSYPFAYSAGLSAFLCSLIAYLSWLKERRIAFAIVTSVFYSTSMLSTEGFAPYVLLFMGLAVYDGWKSTMEWRGRLRRMAVDMLPVAVSLSIHAAIYFVFQWSHPSTYQEVDRNPGTVLRAAAVIWQYASSTVPAYFYVSNPQAMASTFDGFGPLTGGFRGLVEQVRVEWVVKAIILVSLCAAVLRRCRTRMSVPFIGLALLGGLTAIVAPISLLALTVKYQQWVIASHSRAYIHCYYAFFGTTFTLGIVMLALNQLVARRKILSLFYVAVVSGALGVASLAHDHFNYYLSLDQQLSHWKWRTVDRFTLTPDFQALGNGSIIYAPSLYWPRGIVANFPHYWGDYFSLIAGKNLIVSATPEDYLEKRREHPESEFYFLSFYQAPKDANHFMVLAKAPSVPHPASDVVYSTEATLFTYSKYRSFVVMGEYRPDESVEIRMDGETVRHFSGRAFAQNVEKNNWPDDLPRTVITSTTPIDVAHLTISFFPIVPHLTNFDIAYGQGFYGLEKDEAAHTYWSWSAEHSEMSVWNHSAHPVEVCLKLQLMTHSPPRTVTITSGANRQQSVKLETGAHHISTTIPVSLAPGQNKIFLDTDRPSQSAGMGDPRQIAFGVQNAAIGNTCESAP